jgi:putative ABC transport system substrate-binding protein
MHDMKRRDFFAVLVGLIACPLHARAQTVAGRPALIARLHPGFAGDSVIDASLRAFRDGLSALGYVEPQTYRLETRYAEGNPAKLGKLAAELVALRPDVIVAVADDAIDAAKAATANIPIVMAMSTRDPVALGYVASLARPGGNVTGFTGQVEELNTKQLELLREFAPGLTKVAILYNAGSPSVTRERLDRISEAGATLGLSVRQARVAQPADLDTVFEALKGENIQGVIVLPEPSLMDQSRTRIAQMANRHHLASAFTFRMYVEAGGLVSYAQDLPDMHRRSATFVDKILKGIKPADLPVEQPTKFELVINLKTAKALGLTVPPSILIRADEVIE